MVFTYFKHILNIFYMFFLKAKKENILIYYDLCRPTTVIQEFFPFTLCLACNYLISCKKLFVNILFMCTVSCMCALLLWAWVTA